MGVLKGVLKEELGNSLRMKAGYEKALAGLPRGSIVRKKIRGHYYHYLVMREGAKIRFIYKGKLLDDEVSRYRQIKEMRAKYRQLLSRVKRQIKFLRSALRGKELV